ncbi:uncharacterized protein LOC143888581 [Tasmannia lanceolata]|uniref:uncharacterized protein LOC143888581 n=1 Tax=Tasmannia lanceolata TaxID=3420 RepID=UPI004063227F
MGCVHMWGSVREAVGRAYAKFASYNAILANTATSPYLQHFVDVACEYGRGVKAPTSYEIMNKYLPLEVEDLAKYINGLKQQWPEYGVTIMTDGWTGTLRQSIINFMVYCDGKTVFLKSIEASAVNKDYRYIYKLLVEVIKEVGEKIIVQIVTDNRSNYKKEGQQIMEKYHIFWTPCAAHCIDLMLKDIGKTERVKNVVAEAKSVTNFIYNHGYVLSLMREKCGGGLVRPRLTRFATNYVALQSMLDKKVGLKQLFSSSEWNDYRESKSAARQKAEGLVGSPTFWQNCKTIIDILEPRVRVLRMVDGDKKPTMGSMYHAIELMKGEVQTTATRAFQGYHKIIDTRWKNMLLHPLHSAEIYNKDFFFLYAYYLNPKYQYSEYLGPRADLIKNLQTVIQKLEPDANEQSTILSQIKAFRDAVGSFGIASAVAGRANTAPASSSGCERNWSTFNLIHSKRRNKLGHENLHNLVYVHYNTQLRLKHREIDSSREAYTDPLDLTDVFCIDGEEDPLYEWVKEIGEPVLVHLEDQDYDHGARPQHWQSDASQQRHGNRPNDEELDSLDAHSHYGVDSLTDTFKNLSVEGGNSQSHGYGPVKAESGLGSTAYYGYGQYGYGHGYGYGYPYGIDTQTQSQSGSYGYGMPYNS